MPPQDRLSIDHLGQLIYEIRGQRVMFDSDLASIYGVETKALNRAVKRNRDRFPKDFMFQLSEDEWKNLRYQIGTSSSGREHQSLKYQIGTLKTGRGQHRKYRPYVFTEHGAIMAANVLNSPRAVQMAVGACPERSRTGRSRIPQDACLARGQARPGSETCVVGKRTKEATRCPRGRYRHNFTTSHG